MGSNKTDIYHLDSKQNQGHQAILISSDIEDDPVISHIISRIERLFYICKTTPFCVRRFLIPIPQSRLRVFVFSIKLHQRFLRNNSHSPTAKKRRNTDERILFPFAVFTNGINGRHPGIVGWGLKPGLTSPSSPAPTGESPPPTFLQWVERQFVTVLPPPPGGKCPEAKQ